MKSSLLAACVLALAAHGAAADPTVLRFASGQAPPLSPTDVPNFYRIWADRVNADSKGEIGRASCRERVCNDV